MNTLDFFEILVDHIDLYIIILCLSMMSYYYLFRNICRSILDPLFIALLGSMFGTSVVVLLFMTNQIKSVYFISYFLTQFFFIIGLLLVKPDMGYKPEISLRIYKLNNPLYIKSVFYFSFLVFVVSNAIVYAKLGVPIFLKSRLDLTIEAGGWGIFTRFAAISAMIAFYLFLYYIYCEKRKVPKISLYSFFLLYTVTLLLGGSKSGFWNLAIMYFCFMIVNRNVVKIKSSKKIVLKFLLWGGLFAVVVILITFNNDINQSLIFLIQRFVGYGDVYWHAYPNGYIEDLSSKSPFVVIFGSFLGFFRIIDPSQIPEPLGYSLAKMFYSLDYVVGPNPRHNVFGYVYFGFYLSILYSFVLGLIMGSIRWCFFKAYNKSVVCKIVIVCMYIYSTSMETAIDYFFLQVNNLLVVLPVILIGAYSMYVLFCLLKYPQVKYLFLSESKVVYEAV